MFQGAEVIGIGVISIGVRYIEISPATFGFWCVFWCSGSLNGDQIPPWNSDLEASFWVGSADDVPEIIQGERGDYVELGTFVVVIAVVPFKTSRIKETGQLKRHPSSLLRTTSAKLNPHPACFVLFSLTTSYQ